MIFTVSVIAQFSFCSNAIVAYWTACIFNKCQSEARMLMAKLPAIEIMFKLVGNAFAGTFSNLATF